MMQDKQYQNNKKNLQNKREKDIKQTFIEHKVT